MKELSSHIKEEIAIHAEKQHEKQKKLVGSFVNHKGHTIWQIDLKTQEITPAKFAEEYVTIGGGSVRNIIKDDKHWYCSALNKETAFKRFNKMAKVFFEQNTHLYDRINHDR